MSHIYTSLVTIGGIDIYQVSLNPSGVLSARIGSLAVRNDVPALYQNTDGAVAWVLLSGGAGGASPLFFGANSVSNSMTPRYLYPSYDGFLAQTIPIQWRVPRPGVLRFFRMRHNLLGGSPAFIGYTIRVNSIPTALSVLLAANVTDGFDLLNNVPVVAGDLVDLQVTKAAVLVGGGPNDIIGSLELG
jgi:hypothetical protein